MKPTLYLMLALSMSALLTGCGTVSPTAYGDPASGLSCGNLLQSVVERYRTGDTSPEMDSEMDALSQKCSVEYDIATDYFSTSSTSGIGGPSTCASWLEYDIRPEAIELLREDGLCTEAEVSDESTGLWPDGGLGWDVARDYAGTTQRVCGPLMSLRNTDDGAFLNLGVDYPSPDRFTFIIWDVAVEPIEDDATICGAGSIYLYDGVAQVELSSPEQIEIWQ